MTNDELRKLAEGAVGHQHRECLAKTKFHKAATPERILALLDEVDHQSCVAGRSIDTCRHCSSLSSGTTSIDTGETGGSPGRVSRVDERYYLPLMTGEMTADKRAGATGGAVCDATYKLGGL